MENELYDYSPIVDRPVVSWPDGKRVAFYLGLNIEHFRVNVASFGRSSFRDRVVLDHPVPKEHAWLDYGTRVGIWRMIDLLDECGVTATAITNSEVVDFHPQIIDAGLERDWAWVAHGRTNSYRHIGLTAEEEAAELDDIVATFAERGIRPRGWLGPGLSETFATNRLLRERGFDYNLDWIADDRPFALNESGMWSVPYSSDVNDLALFLGQSTTPAQYADIVRDQLEVLLEEGGGVFALPVHPYSIGVPFRFKYFRTVLREIAAHPDVWVTTSDEIASHYQGDTATR